MNPIKRLIPRSLKEAVKSLARDREMASAVGELKRLGAGGVPSVELLARFEAGWGADGFRAVGGFLAEVVRRASETEGPILEVGSGLTTLLLGLLAGRRGVRVYTLEHSAEFHRHTQGKLERHGVRGVRLVHAPLRDYGEFAWYDPPLEDFPRDFRLVIADGPPGDTKGGRFGLLPVMGARLAAEAVVLLDDAEREEERECLRRWREEYGLSCETHSRGGKAWAVCARA